MREDFRETIEKIIEVCSESIYTDSVLNVREPIGRSDTYIIRNTLQTILNIDKKELLNQQSNNQTSDDHK